MSHDALMQVVASLFSIIASLTGLPLNSDTLPEVQFVPHSQIEAMACQQPCRIQAIYLPHLGIFLDQDLDVVNDDYARSILLHELVHHAQAVMAKYEDLSLCESWKSSEAEAYKIQDYYLVRVGSARRIMPGIAQRLRCD
ncbi:MAG: hypothetical protein M3Q00_04325 [Pseudomonadota bacterium]|nr:hypothetical protein [Pseudomonadota bacterium]